MYKKAVYQSFKLFKHLFPKLPKPKGVTQGNLARVLCILFLAFDWWKAVNCATSYIDPSEAVVYVIPLGLLGSASKHLGYITYTTASEGSFHHIYPHQIVSNSASWDTIDNGCISGCTPLSNKI